MKKSSEIAKDLSDLGFKFRATSHKKNGVEILHDNRWWRLYNRQERMIVMAIIRTELRDLGYSQPDLEAATDVVRASGV